MYKLPTSNLAVLLRWDGRMDRWARKHTSSPVRINKAKNWRRNLMNSLALSVNDTTTARKILETFSRKGNHKDKNNLFVIHLMKAKTKRVLGFYNNYTAFIGQNKSHTIAHESVHHLGAPDLYIHKYWFGRRRWMVKKYFPDDIMNTSSSNDVGISYLGDYTAYCIGWNANLDKKYKPLLKQNLMALFLFYIFLK